MMNPVAARPTDSAREWCSIPEFELLPWCNRNRHMKWKWLPLVNAFRTATLSELGSQVRQAVQQSAL